MQPYSTCTCTFSVHLYFSEQMRTTPVTIVTCIKERVRSSFITPMKQKSKIHVENETDNT